jgi:succinate dehydrogenase/fumarate reductase flavoprotein subunit
METAEISNHVIRLHRFDTVIVGAGAAGLNCAVHLHEFLRQAGVNQPQRLIAVVARGIELGASRMSGSDKQTYYKLGTRPDTPDSAAAFAASLTAGGACHHDLALAEGISSLCEFYHLSRSGVPFPRDVMGAYVGYKTDHDPGERATSAGPKTSRYMAQCLQREVQAAGIPMFDGQEAASLLVRGEGADRRIIGVACLDGTAGPPGRDFAINVFLCRHLVLAAGGPGELYETSVYPAGQMGLHGLALEAGLAAENLTEWQFGLASTLFRWNVSGTYMQVIPRIYSATADGSDEREFLTEAFPTMRQLAGAIFRKGYQWPFDPQRVENYGSSLIDLLVFNETSCGRHVFMDFRHNPRGPSALGPFCLADLDTEALGYLQAAGAMQERPIDRLAHMNAPAIEIFAEHGIDLARQPLPIAVCAQHNNGGLAVNAWWESSVPGTFVIGEMAGTHGVKRPGGSALNAGQVGGLRAAEFIANAGGAAQAADEPWEQIQGQVEQVLGRLDGALAPKPGRRPGEVLAEIRQRMSAAAAHVRKEPDIRRALDEAVALRCRLEQKHLAAGPGEELVQAIQARHLALTSVACLKAIWEYLRQGGGSRGSYLVASQAGREIHPGLIDGQTGRPLRYLPENESLRQSILRLRYDAAQADLFSCQNISPRPAPPAPTAFEPAWADFREKRIYSRLPGCI